MKLLNPVLHPCTADLLPGRRFLHTNALGETSGCTFVGREGRGPATRLTFRVDDYVGQFGPSDDSHVTMAPRDLRKAIRFA